ncbi:hypothetical protein MMC27_003555 [Xylographa pallens]|nr:hypothetical protein [Xylographa pallens]
MDSQHPIAAGEPIVVIGSGCRFPGGASSPSKLWELLSNPRDVLSEIPSTRFNPHGFYHVDGEYHGHSNVKHSYLLDEDHRVFDVDFFNVSANEASAIDPQQRVLMECVYEALEDAGQPMSRLKGSDTAVYVGLMCEEYSDLQSRELNMMPTYFPTGTARSVVSNRISYFFDWHGPSMTIDTACSSSLVAVHQGVQALRSGASQLVIAAGTNLILGPEPYIAESTFHMLSPRGRSHMWDAGADGYGRGDGVAAVVLKRLSDAIADGDVIDYVIRETGVNQDGRTKGITVPSPDAQVDLVQKTYLRAGLDLSTAAGRPQFFEAHGTGTLAGDPVEAEAIHRAIGSRISSDAGQSKLLVGSIKSIIGHTEGTAGIAGLMKVGLALRHGKVPPNMLFRNLNPAIEPFYKHVRIPTKYADWPEVVAGQPRRASVNSFGFGGTNAHAVVESFGNDRADEPTMQSLSCFAPFTFSANSKSSLKRYLEAMVEYLGNSLTDNLINIGYTLHSRRSTFPFRTTYAGSSVQDLQERIAASLSAPDWESSAITRASGQARILGIFTGQGAQWPGMGRELIESSGFVRARLERLQLALSALPPADRPTWSLKAELLADKKHSKLHMAQLAQPLCTALQILLIDLLRAAGVTFAAVVGHSSGEIACAYAAGFLSARDAIVIAYYRGFHSHLAGGPTGQPGSMMAVGTGPEDAQEVCELPQFKGRVCVAACNSPESVTLSGDADAIEEAKVMFDDEGKFARVLQVDKAYHSHHMEAPGDAYLRSLQKVAISARASTTDCIWYSSVYHGQRVNGTVSKKALDGQYWCDNMKRQVSFSAAVEAAILDSGLSVNVALEIGPHSALKGPVQDTMKYNDKEVSIYSSCLVRNRDGRESFTEALGELWKNGAESMLALDRFEIAVSEEHKISPKLVKGLPSYQWEHERPFWHESRRSKALRTRSRPGHPLLGTISPDSTELDLVWHNVLRLTELPWLNGHQLQGQTVFPAAGYVALAIEAAAWAAESRVVQLIEIHDLVIGKAITFEDERSNVETMFSLTIESNEQHGKARTLVASFRAHSAAGDAGAAPLNSTGRIKILFADEHPVAPIRVLPPREPGLEGMVPVDEDDFYSELRKLGYHYSGPFRALQTMKRKFDHGCGYVNKPQHSKMHISEQQLLVHPGFLDAAFQAIFLAYSWPGDGRLYSLHVPVSIRRIRVDATLCRFNDDRSLAFDSVLAADGSSSNSAGIVGDVDIFNADGSQGMIQVEGIHVIPFAPATAAQDTQMFFENVSGVSFPDGELVVSGNTAPDEEIAMGWVLERISYFYLRRLVEEISSEEEETAAWHHQKLMAYARHMVEMVKNGRQPYGKEEWKHDTTDMLQQLMNEHSEKIEVSLMRSVGEHLAANVRGETVILEHMMKDGMLDQYYVESLGLRPYTTFLTEVIGQITHVHPHLHMLEIGAGTGGATKSIIRKIDGAFDSYAFTDISSGFFETARGVFAEFAGRMTFEVLDAEKDVAEQGFQEQSYDLIIASLVLHATKDLQYTLSNVRRLLRPGGFLVMLEVTSNATMRMSFTMGGLSGWWLGADSGRPWSPCVSTAQWHTLLLDSGFTGVEASTPEQDTLPRPFSVLVSRAADQRIDLLIAPSLEPSPLSAMEEMIIISGSSLEGHQVARAAQRMLRPHCSSIRTVQALDELATWELSSRASVLNLMDWDEPVFQNLSSSSFTALQSLFSHAHTVVWATRGRQRDQPYANMSVGFGRAMMMEYPHLLLHLIDFETGAKPSAQLLVDELLRMSILARLPDDPARPLWSRETEVIVDAAGRGWVPRVKPHGYFNHCYNASRRHIQVDVVPSRNAVHLSGSQLRHVPLPAPHHGSPTTAAKPQPEPETETETETARIEVLYSSHTALRVLSGPALYPSIGVHERTRRPVVVLAESIASLVEVRKQRLVPYLHSLEDAPSYLKAIADDLLASLICSEADADGCLLLLEPDEGLARAVQAVASSKGVGLACIISSTDKSVAGFIQVHPRASRRTIKHLLPSRVSLVVDLSNSVGQSDSLATRIQDCLGGLLRVDNVESFRSRDSGSAPIDCLLEDTVESAGRTEFGVAVFSAEEFAIKRQKSGAILDWTATEKVPVRLFPSDSIPLLQPNCTYILVGLAGNGGLGLSLAEYLIRQGARYIVLTSRNPNVNEKLIARYAAQGVRIAMISNDVTDEVSLRQVIADVRASWPPIAGVANGAMVLHDTSLETMSYDQMMRVLRPKVIGTRLLDEIFRNDSLDFFVMFSSLASVFGNSGQSNYSAANMYMMSLAAQRRQRGVAASVIDIGAVMGTGYMAREVSEDVLAQLVGAGYRKMSERDFHVAFANAIISGRVGADYAEELITGLHMAAPGENINPAWSGNARFGHVLRTSKQTDAVSSNASSLTESARILLERARTRDDIAQILQGAILDKLEHMLQLSAEIANDHATFLEQGMDSLGIDSLVAVEVRSWMLREIDVDIPVLKILGETSVRDIVNIAQDKLPEELVPNLGQPGSADLPALGALRKKPVTALPKSGPTPVSAELLRQPEKDAPSQNGCSVVPSTAKSIMTPDKTESVGSGVEADAESSNTSVSASLQGFNLPPKPMNPPPSQPSPVRLASPVLGLEKTVPMSWSQSRFWVMNQIVEDPSAFNVSCHLELTGELEPGKLARAVIDLGKRHEALKTCFFIENNQEPVQGVLKASPLRLEIGEASASIQKEFRALQQHSYDLSKGETMKMMLFSHSSLQHDLLVGYHHINMDSTSLALLVHDLRRLYTGEKLLPARLQYPDFALHQLEQLRNGHWDDQLTFWRNEFLVLPDPLPILNVSPNTSRPRPTLTTYNNTHAETRLSEKLTRQVQALGRKLKATPFHVYCTVFQILLARLAAVDDVCIGFADANRSAPGAMESIGNFLNLLPLRLSTALSQPFSALVKETKSKVLSALAHSAVPFDVILEEVGVRRSPTHSPLFQAFIDYRHVVEVQPFGKGQLKGKEYALSKTPYDIMLDIIDGTTGAASVNMITQEDLYTAEEAQLLLSCYINLLTTLTEDSDLAAGDVSMFDSQEVDQALKLGQGQNIELPNGSYLDKIDEIAAIQPDSLALKDGSGNELTWTQMVSRSYAVAQALKELHIRQHGRVGVLQQPTVDWLVCMLGIWRAGCSYVPLETTQGTGRLTEITREAQLAAIIFHDETFSNLAEIGWPESGTAVNVSRIPAAMVSTETFSAQVSAEDEAMVFYTSGSTGIPKGIAIAHRVVSNSIISFLDRWPMSPQTVLQQVPLSFDVSWWTALLGLATEGKVVVAAQAARRDPQALTKLIVSEEITLSFAVPSETISWLQAGNLDKLRNSKWVWHFSGGEPYSFNLIQHLRILRKPSLRAINVYGPTEAMIPAAHEVLYNITSANDMPVPIGRVLPNYDVYVVDEQNHPVPVGISGQFIYAGAGIASGYVNDPLLSARKFPIDSRARPDFVRRGWRHVHRSGDYGYLRKSDGVLMLQARINGDTQVKLRGLRMDMMDIEANLISVGKDKISEAVVHVRKPKNDDSSTHFLAAHVVLTEEALALYPSDEEKSAFFGRVVKELPLPIYMRPARVVHVQSLPLNHHGKVDRQLISTLALGQTRTRDDVSSEPGSVQPDNQIRMKGLWQQVIGETIRSHLLEADTDFFLVGGNSLSLIRIQREIKKEFGVDVQLVELFQRTTLSQMASLLDATDRSQPGIQAASIDWSEEIRLSPDIENLRAPVSASLRSDGIVIALTGATGFLGRALLRMLIDEPRIRTVYCLAVRDPKRLADISSNKLVIYQGDLAYPNLGMGPMEAQTAFSTADIVIHNGADTSFMKSYATVKGVNMTSTKEITRLALRHGHVNHLHYVSTAGIATQLGNDLYNEPLGSLPPSTGTEGYVLSKWASELFLENVSSATGLRLTIHRPTAIVGPEAPRLDVMHNVLYFSEQLGAVPRMEALEGTFQFVGVNTVAQEMLGMLLAPPPASLVQYKNHCGSPDDTVPVNDLGRYLSQKLDASVTVLPDSEWIKSAEAAGLGPEVASYLKGITTSYTGGQKWVFPKIWDSTRPEMRA